MKDFVSVAGQLNVSHLVVFSSTDSGAYMRFMKMPQVSDGKNRTSTILTEKNI